MFLTKKQIEVIQKIYKQAHNRKDILLFKPKTNNRWTTSILCMNQDNENRYEIEVGSATQEQFAISIDAFKKIHGDCEIRKDGNVVNIIAKDFSFSTDNITDYEVTYSNTEVQDEIQHIEVDHEKLFKMYDVIKNGYNCQEFLKSVIFWLDNLVITDGRKLVLQHGIKCNSFNTGFYYNPGASIAKIKSIIRNLDIKFSLEKHLSKERKDEYFFDRPVIEANYETSVEISIHHYFVNDYKIPKIAEVIPKDTASEYNITLKAEDISKIKNIVRNSKRTTIKFFNNANDTTIFCDGTTYNINISTPPKLKSGNMAFNAKLFIDAFELVGTQKYMVLDKYEPITAKERGNISLIMPMRID